jgi:hypothetical protein
VTIPEVREDMLHEAAHCPDLFLRSKLLAWEAELHRRPPVRKVRREARSVTEASEQAIREYAARHPQASYRKMSAVFGQSIGRISEALAGKRS